MAGCATAPLRNGLVAPSVGRVVLESDHGSTFRASVAIDDEYQRRIKALPLEQRLQFFWSVMMNVDLDASFVTDFLELIMNDAPDAFVAKLEAFLEQSRAAGIQGLRQDIAARTLNSLQKLRAARRQSGFVATFRAQEGGGQVECRPVSPAVASAVGQVIVEYDRTQRLESEGSGSLWTYEAFEAAYATLRDRTVAERVEFLWAVMMHVPLQNDFERMFLEFVNRNCRPPFEAKLRTFLTRSRQVGADGSEQARARHVLGDLRRLKPEQ